VSVFGDRVMTSPDGINWTARSAAGDDDSWRGITYGNGLFVAVSYSGGDRVMTSPDGINWTARSAAGDDDEWYGITYGNGLFVAVGSTGVGDRVITSGKGEINTLSANNIYQGGMNIYGNVGIGNSTPSGLLSVGSTGTDFIVNSSGVVTAGTWQGSAIGVGYGGTGLTTFTDAGRLLYSTSATGLTTLASSTYGTVLMTQSTGYPGWTATSSLGLLGSNITASLSANYVPKWTGSVFNNSLIYDTGTYLGIGTTSPGYKLTVVSSNATDNLLQIATTTNQSIFTINNQGRVGIGTSSPYATFSIVDSGGSGLRDVFVISTSTTGAIFKVDSYGQVWADNGTLGAPADYAEYFYTINTDLGSGEAVCVDVENKSAVKRCLRQADNDIIGIVSTRPLIVGNAKPEYVNNKNYVKVAMLGQIPAKVSAENGPVRPGDSLTSAKQIGYIARAEAGDSTVGVALESLDAGTGVINVLISRRNKSLTVEQVEQSVTDRVAAMKIEDEVRIMISSAVDSLNLGTEITPIVNEQIALLKSGLTVSVDDLNSQLISTKADVALLAQQVAALGQSVDLRFTIYDLRIEELNAKLASSTLASSQSMVVDAFGNIKMGNNIANTTSPQPSPAPGEGGVIPSPLEGEGQGEVAIVEIDALSTATALVVRQMGDGNIAEFQGPEVSVMTVEGGGEVKIVGTLGVDGRILVCSGGVCPAGLDNSVDSTLGDVGVEGKVVAGAYESYCADGFAWVPGSSKYGTMPGFCVMSRLARRADLAQTNADFTPTTASISDASSTPWVNISQGEAAIACQSVGDNYHLLTENEWLTVAENAIRIGDNDIDKATAGLQLSTLSIPLSGGVAEGQGGFVLSNGARLYDLVGTISQWTDQTITKTGLPALANSTPASIGSWQEYYNVDDYKGQNINPPYYYTAAQNGIGQILLGAGDANLRGFVRGYNGLYSLDLSNAPTLQSPVVGFRCAK